MTDLASRFHDAPLDTALVATLSAGGLTPARVDDADRAQVDAWLGAVARGFLDGEPNDQRREAFFDHTAYRRKIGVYDTDALQPLEPVATFASQSANPALHAAATHAPATHPASPFATEHPLPHAPQ